MGALWKFFSGEAKPGDRVQTTNVGDECADCGGTATGAYVPPGGNPMPICLTHATERSGRDYGRA